MDNNDGKGLVFKNISVTKSEENNNIYTIKFDIENKTEAPLKKNYILANLVDSVKSQVIKGNFIYWADDYERITLDMLANEIYKAEYDIKIDKEWQTLDIYLRETDSETGSTNDIKVFTYENNLPEITTELTSEETTREIITEETTTINIITE